MTDVPLDDVEEFVGRFVAFPSEHALVAFVLWAAHTHALEAFESTPRLALLSPEPGSGKTRAQEVLALLVPSAMFTVNASTAYLFRRLAAGDESERPTVLLDEADTIFGPRASKDHEDLRGFVNTGHRRGATYGRCELRGKEVHTVDFPAYAAVSVSGLDDLPDTIMTRAVVIRMKRRGPGDDIQPFRHRTHSAEGAQLRDAMSKWMNSQRPELDDLWPVLPDGIEDRNADVWEALLSVADAAGGKWPDRARDAAVALVAQSRQTGETLGIRLLADVRRVFRTAGEDVDRLPTEDLLDGLNALEDAPWGDLRGKPLDARGLSRRLGKYGVSARTAKDRHDKTRSRRHYMREDLHDPWSRYLPASPQGSATSATPQPPDADGVAQVAQVADLWGDAPKTQAERCRACGDPLDAALIAAGYTTHPNCGPT